MLDFGTFTLDDSEFYECFFSTTFRCCALFSLLLEVSWISYGMRVCCIVRGGGLFVQECGLGIAGIPDAQGYDCSLSVSMLRIAIVAAYLGSRASGIGWLLCELC